MKLAWWSWASGYQTDLKPLFCGKTTTRLIWCGKKTALSDRKLVARPVFFCISEVLGIRIQSGIREPFGCRSASAKTLACRGLRVGPSKDSWMAVFLEWMIGSVASQAAWYRMETGRNPNMGNNWPNIREWPSAWNGEKIAQNGEKIGIWGHFSIFLPFWGHFFPISGRGPFSIFWPVLSHFLVSARFPFKNKGAWLAMEAIYPECLGGSLFTYNWSLCPYSWAYSPLRYWWDARSHCKQRSSNCKKLSSNCSLKISNCKLKSSNCKQKAPKHKTVGKEAQLQEVEDHAHPKSKRFIWHKSGGSYAIFSVPMPYLSVAFPWF